MRSSFFSWSNLGTRHGAFRRPRPGARLELEVLETRSLLSGSTISGHVYNDLNNNGLRDSAEPLLASVPIELRNASGIVIGSTSTDASGFYQFKTDSTVPAQADLTRTASVVNLPTDWTRTVTIDPFDPSLGTLTSVDIINAGAITSQIKVESLDAAPSKIAATIAGTLTLTGPGASNLVANLSALKTYNAAAFDGTIDFGGASGNDFGSQTAPGSRSITLTAQADLAAFMTGAPVSYTIVAKAQSSATGAGNLISQVNTSASSQLTVVYHYKPDNSLKPGNYVIVETVQPASFFDGRESSGGTILPNSVGTDTIPVTITNGDSPNNDFGELQPASIAGVVYVDNNNNGQQDPGEAGIAGTTIKLTGTTDVGPVSTSLVTRVDGSYQFNNLRPGTYSVQEVQPNGYLNGKISVGSAGGTPGADQFTAITLSGGVAADKYNFGELLPSSLAGSVYLDANNNGKRDAGETGIAGVTVTMSGAIDQGTVNLSATTDQDGHYQFTNLRPGTYTVREQQPAGYADGRESLGSIGGTLGNDIFSAVNLPMGVQAIDYNFGEILPASLAGNVYHDRNNNGLREVGEVGIGNVTLTLSGTNDLGDAVNITTTTAADGSYKFANLRPGSYTIAEAQPAAFLDGKDTLGSIGGNKNIKNQLGSVTLAMGQAGVEYNFGELLPASIAGFVYLDGNNNGIKEDNESGIFNVRVTLTGANDLGQPITLETMTGQDGSYQFIGLRPGIYSLTETQPDKYLNGKITAGSLGGASGADQFVGVPLGSDIHGINYNFGELVKPGDTGQILSDFGIRIIDAMQTPKLPVLGKTQYLSTQPDGTFTPQVWDNAFFVQGLYQKLLGRPGDPMGLLFWVVQLMDGKSRQDVARAFYRSAEYRSIEVNDFFTELLRRDADAGAKQTFAGQLTNGLSETDVQVAIITDPGLEFTINDPSNAAFVRQLYDRVLHRGERGQPPGPAEVNFWVGQLNSGASRANVARAFLNSQERFANFVVDSAYNDILQRAADAPGGAFWVAQLTQGRQTPESLAVAFLASDEFFQKMKTLPKKDA